MCSIFFSFARRFETHRLRRLWERIGDMGVPRTISRDRWSVLLDVLGFVTVETEHGHLLLGDDRSQTYTVLANLNPATAP